jgi:hypothetical protein
LEFKVFFNLVFSVSLLLLLLLLLVREKLHYTLHTVLCSQYLQKKKFLVTFRGGIQTEKERERENKKEESFFWFKNTFFCVTGLFQKCLNIKKNKSKKKMMQWLSQVPLATEEKRRYKSLSRNKQQVAIAASKKTNSISSFALSTTLINN